MKKPELCKIIDTLNSVLEDNKITVEDREKSLLQAGIDSIDFITFIVQLELDFDFEFPDYLLNINELDSINRMYEIMDKIYSQNPEQE